MADEKSDDELLAEIEELRAKKRADRDTQEKKQRIVDEKALMELEDEHGEGQVQKLVAPRFVPGIPTFAVLRMPSRAEYKRYQDQIHRAKQRNDAKLHREAHDTLAESCWLYPSDKSMREKMAEAFPAIHVSVAVAANKLAELDAEEAGKG